MAVDAHHPQWDILNPLWIIMRDCEAGEHVVKDKGTAYLPMPGGFTAQSDGGNEMYSTYKLRARFPDIVQPTLAGMVGVIHRVDAVIEGLEDGKPLAYMWEKATKDEGLTLEAFHRRITTEILLMARYNILTDVPSEGDGLPYLVGYTTEQLINWSQFERNLFVLDEGRKVQGEEDEFTWIDEQRHRVLRLQDGVYTMQVYNKENIGDILVQPQVRGGKQLEEIPFVIVGPRDLSSQTIDPPPLLGVALSSLAIYRLDADYRHQLFNTGQEIAVFIGETENIPRVLGSGVVIGLPLQSDAKYIGPTGVGIAAHRLAIQDERASAVAAGVRLFDTQAKAESGDALRLRAAAQTATLTTIAQSSAAALEKALRYAAMFVGQDPKEIVVKPNLKFVDTAMTTQDALYLVQVWQAGAISRETLYEDLQRGEIASVERTFDEEKALIDKEAIDNPVIDPNTGLPAAGAPGAIGGPGPAKAQQNAPSSRFTESGVGLKVIPGGA